MIDHIRSDVSDGFETFHRPANSGIGQAETHCAAPQRVELESFGSNASEAAALVSEFSPLTSGSYCAESTNWDSRESTSQPAISYGARILLEPSVGSQVHPANLDKAVERFLTVQRLFKSGDLHEEVEALGVDSRWLDRLHRDPPTVAIFEQLAPLALNFAALGESARPAVLRRTLQDLTCAVSLLAENEVHGATLGYLSSRHHVVTFHGITESFHLSLPGSEGPERKWLFSTGERKRFDASGYLDLALSKDRLEEFRAGFIVLAGVAPEAGQRRAAEFLVSDWDRAIAMSDKAADGSIAFCEFVPHLNAALVERYGLAEGTFESRFHDVVDGLATVGVSNWPRFVTQLLRSGALDPQDTVLRLRTFNSKGLPRYLSLHLESPGDDFDRRGDVILADKDSKAPGSYSLNDLVSRSQASLRDGNGITLVPAAPICYWANFAVGNVLGFLDGSVNYRLHRVARAMMSREMTNNPRPLTVAPYTSLVHHVPENPHRPYHGIEEVGNVLDFYTLPNLE